MTLFLAPSGKPTITAAHNTSSTSIQLSWRPPPTSSLNGEFLGYRISYRPRHSNASNLSSEAFISDPDVGQFLIKGLTPFTQYLVSLQVRNPAGLGPPTKVVIMTDEGGNQAPTTYRYKPFLRTLPMGMSYKLNQSRNEMRASKIFLNFTSKKLNFRLNCKF